MVNPHHLQRLGDVDAWNRWRAEHVLEYPDLRRADLSGAELSGAELSGADLSGANLSYANLTEVGLVAANLYAANLNAARLSHANLTNAELSWTILSEADMSRANLAEATMHGALLSGANLSGADLYGADLTGATLIWTNLENANLESARVYGASVWDVRGAPAAQNNLIITSSEVAEVTVDNLKVTQFIYLLLSNDEIRDVIDTITSKAILILGRFTPERKPALDNMRHELRARYNYTPIVFDFEKPANKTVADTVKLLANMARFVVVDLTDATSANFEVGMITNLGLRRLPIAFMIERGCSTMSMLSTDVLDYPEVVDEVFEYDDLADLAATIVDGVLDPSERLWHELNGQTWAG